MTRFRIYKIFATLIGFASLGTGSLTLAHSPHDEIQLLAVSPQYATDSTLFVKIENLGSYFGRLQKSTDGGLSWAELGNGLDNQSFLISIAISPGFEVDGTCLSGPAGTAFLSHQMQEIRGVE